MNHPSIKRATVSIPMSAAREVNNILQSDQMDPTGEDVVYSCTVTFDDGCSADIKVCNGEPPYIDPVLFDRQGHEVCLIESIACRIEGDYHWWHDGKQYIATVRAV